MAKGNGSYLLDTHTLLFALTDEKRLGKIARAVLLDPTNEIFVSPISAYEIFNKNRLGKLCGCERIVADLPRAIEALGVEHLPITMPHLIYAGEFKWDHRDPFDRILAAQAFKENMILITKDEAFADLPWLSTLW
jgi:PIN domain nuclease of toxin-antitoxin system